MQRAVALNHILKVLESLHNFPESQQTYYDCIISSYIRLLQVDGRTKKSFLSYMSDLWNDEKKREMDEIDAFFSTKLAELEELEAWNV